MGISNLLRALESIQINRHLSYYKGMKMAVDGYCWLHKSVYSMTNEIFENPNSKKYLAYLIRRLDQLLKFNIHPIIIFDGDKLPMKNSPTAALYTRSRSVCCRFTATLATLAALAAGDDIEDAGEFTDLVSALF